MAKQQVSVAATGHVCGCRRDGRACERGKRALPLMPAMQAHRSGSCHRNHARGRVGAGMEAAASPPQPRGSGRLAAADTRAWACASGRARPPVAAIAQQEGNRIGEEKKVWETLKRLRMGFLAEFAGLSLNYLFFF